MKQFLVVAYDITDDRRRQRVSKLLVKYGIRCNESVFECMLTQSNIEKMKQQLLKLVDESQDCLLYYFLCAPCVSKRESVGRKPGFESELIMI